MLNSTIISLDLLKPENLFDKIKAIPAYENHDVTIKRLYSVFACNVAAREVITAEYELDPELFYVEVIRTYNDVSITYKVDYSTGDISVVAGPTAEIKSCNITLLVSYQREIN